MKISVLDLRPAVAYEVIGTRLSRSPPMLSVIFHALEFLAYHAIISVVDRVSVVRGLCMDDAHPC